MIKAGDSVKVTNWGRSYSGYYNLFESHNISINYAARFAYNDISNFERFSMDADDKRVFHVLQVVDDEVDTIALISLGQSYDEVYLVACGGLELVIPEGGRPMTTDEIEKELGYKVNIISK